MNTNKLLTANLVVLVLIGCLLGRMAFYPPATPDKWEYKVVPPYMSTAERVRQSEWATQGGWTLYENRHASNGDLEFVYRRLK